VRHLHSRAKRHAPERRSSYILDFNRVLTKAKMCVGVYRLAEIALALRKAVPSITSDGRLRIVETPSPLMRFSSRVSEPQD
jgi:hypothetical protein